MYSCRPFGVLAPKVFKIIWQCMSVPKGYYRNASCTLKPLLYVYWCPTRYPSHMMSMSFKGNTTDAISETGTVFYSGEPEFTSVVRGFVLLNLY